MKWKYICKECNPFFCTNEASIFAGHLEWHKKQPVSVNSAELALLKEQLQEGRELASAWKKRATTLTALLREAGKAILPVKEASKNHEPLPGVHSYSVFFTDEEIARAAEVAAKIEEALA